MTPNDMKCLAESEGQERAHVRHGEGCAVSGRRDRPFASCIVEDGEGRDSGSGVAYCNAVCDQ